MEYVVNLSKKAKSKNGKSTFFIKLFFSICIFAILILLNSNLPLLSSILLDLLILIMFPSKNIISKIVAFLYVFLLTIMLNFEIIKFNFIPQAKVLLDSNTSVLYWFSVGHPHAIRLLISFPAYYLSNFFNINLDLAYSIYGILMFMLIYLIVMNTVIKLKKVREKFRVELTSLFLLIPLIILPTIMNGRLIVAYLGFSILLNLSVSLFLNEKLTKLNILIKGVIGFTLTTVSSGTMTVAFIYLLAIIFILVKKNKISIRYRLIFLTILSPIIYIAFDYVLKMFQKNINFFGGGINGFINMLNHGIGRYLELTKFQFFTFFIVFTILAVISFIMFQERINIYSKNIPIILGIGISIIGLLFGYSTGSMIIIPLIIIVLIYL